MNKEDLKNIAKKTLEFHPKEKEVLVTSDGHSFLKKNESFARNHATRNGHTIETYSRDEIMGAAAILEVELEDKTLAESDPVKDSKEVKSEKA